MTSGEGLLVGNVDDDAYGFNVFAARYSVLSKELSLEGNVDSFIILSELLVSPPDRRPPCIHIALGHGSSLVYLA